MAQFDFQSGFDISSLTSVSQAQLMQAINQIAPLSNIGGIVVGNDTTYPTGPSVINDPRFARYIWIDTTAIPYTLKTYNGSAWVASTLGVGSLSSATQIVDGIITYAKLAAGTGNATKLFRVNAAGTLVELVLPSGIFSADDLDVTLLDDTLASVNNFLRIGSAGPEWVGYDPTGDVIGLPLNKLATGTPLGLIRYNSSGIVHRVSNDDKAGDFLAAGSATTGVGPGKLCTEGNANGALMYCNGTNMTIGTPIMNIMAASYSVAVADTFSTKGWVQVANPLGAIPKMVFPHLYCVSTDAATEYATGDVIGLGAVALTGDSSVPTGNYAQFVATTTYFRFHLDTNATKIQMKTTNYTVATPTAPTNFKFRVFYLG